MNARPVPGILTLGGVAAATNGRVVAGQSDTALAGVSIDSRTLRPGELFIAIKGPHFDGHDFLGDAFERGAAAALIHRDVDATAGRALVRVADTAVALAELGHQVRLAANIPLIAITGSMGKTTTKDMAARLLEVKGPVLKTEGNLNNQYGLPLTLTGLGPAHASAVLELGMSAPGELRTLSQIAVPDVAVITNVAPVHLEFFPSVDAIAQAKAEILEGLRQGGVAVLNADDARVRAIGQGHRGRVLWFGRGKQAQVAAREWRSNGSGMRFRLVIEGGTAEVALPLAGPHFIDNFLAAAAAVSVLGVPIDEIAKAGASMVPPPHRGRVVHLKGGVSLLDDCYNANPEAVTAAVDALRLVSGRRRVAFLGDMLELGPTSPALHCEVGRRIADHLDVLVVVGALAPAILDGARAAGLPAASVAAFPDSAAAAEAAAMFVADGDAVLVKGSRGIRMERIVEALVAQLGTKET